MELVSEGHCPPWALLKVTPLSRGQSARVQRLGPPSSFRTALEGHVCKPPWRISFCFVAATFAQSCFSHSLADGCTRSTAQDFLASTRKSPFQSPFPGVRTVPVKFTIWSGEFLKGQSASQIITCGGTGIPNRIL